MGPKQPSSQMARRLFPPRVRADSHNASCFLSVTLPSSFRQTDLCSHCPCSFTFRNGTWQEKVNCTLVQALRLCTGRTAHWGSRGIALPFHNHGTRRGWGFSVTRRPFFTQGKTRYPFYSMLGGPQGRSGQVRKISPPPPPGFDPRTVQPVDRYLNL